MQALALFWNDDFARPRRAPVRPRLPSRSRVVAHRRHLPDLPPLVRRQLGRRRRRPARRHRAPRRSRRARRRRALAEPVPALPAEGRRLRRRRLLRRRPALRHARRLRRRCSRRRTAAASASSSTSCRTTRPISTSGSRRRWPPAPGSPERARYLFRDGKGKNGELPPNNWESVFGGPAWTRVIEADGTPGQWYLHLFDSSQPDFDWSNEEVREEFRRILRFWLDRGVDGFRVDVAHGLIKADGLPDYTPPADAGLDGRRRGRRAVLGAARRARRLPRLARHPRRVRRRPRAVRRGVAPDARRHCAVGASRRDAPGVQLPLPDDRMGCRRTARRHRRVAARLHRRRRSEHVGALEPRRRPPRVAARADAPRTRRVTASARTRPASRSPNSDSAAPAPPPR